MATMDELLQSAVQQQASDLHITVGLPPIIRINGKLSELPGMPLSVAETEQMLLEIVNSPEMLQKYQKNGELDFSYAIRGVSRFRINAFRQRGSVAIVARVITEKIPSLDELGLPEILKTFSRKPRGLILVTGPTGSGKSTTLAAMIDLINKERSCHIITLEDPIEFLHKHKLSVINQREVGTDTLSFASGLRAALREDPDVVLVGEMRDIETISIAVRAAETGHLVLATLHTGDAAQTIDRIIDVYPPYQQQQIRLQLSLTLQGIVSQQLLPRQDGRGRVAILEVLTASPAVRNLIREGKTHQLLSTLQTGGKLGMQSMDVSLRDAWRSGLISKEEALSHTLDAEGLMRLLNG